jgi:hypothetical protein
MARKYQKCSGREVIVRKLIIKVNYYVKIIHQIKHTALSKPIQFDEIKNLILSLLISAN